MVVSVQIFFGIVHLISYEVAAHLARLMSVVALASESFEWDLGPNVEVLHECERVG